MTIQIGDGTERDLSYYNMELISSPQAFGGEIKSSNIVKTDFPEEDGDVVYIPIAPKVVSFDYKIKLAFIAQSGQTPAQKIMEFMGQILGKKITVKNLHKGVKIEGYPTKYADAEFTPDKRVAIFDLTIYVPSGKAISL